MSLKDSGKFNLGPGQYILSSIIENQRLSSGHKFNKAVNMRSPKHVEGHQKQRHANPGPGTYITEPCLESSPRNLKRTITMQKDGSLTKLSPLGGKMKRSNLGLSKDKLSFPGPGDYEGHGPSIFELL